MSYRLERMLELLDVFETEFVSESAVDIIPPTPDDLLARSIYNRLSGKPQHPFIRNSETGLWSVPKFSRVTKQDLLTTFINSLAENHIFAYILDLKTPQKPPIGKTSIFGVIQNSLRIVDFSGAYQGNPQGLKVIEMMDEIYPQQRSRNEHIKIIKRLYEASNHYDVLIDGYLDDLPETKDNLLKSKERIEHLIATYLNERAF